jgi:iduronate 2-sulfatase
MPDIAWANEGCHTLTSKHGIERMQLRKPVSAAAAEELRRGYFAAVSWVDFCAGRVLKGLEDAGLSKDTLILLSSDHGFHLGEQGSWTKHTLFEVGVRVPLMLHVPGMARIKRTQHFVELTDIYRTLADFAGLPPPPKDVQGASLRQIVQGDAAVRPALGRADGRRATTPGTKLLRLAVPALPSEARHALGRQLQAPGRARHCHDG